MKRTLISKTGQKIRLMSIKGKTFVTLGKKNYAFTFIIR